jgi:Tol biopolymer transport system component
MKHLLALVAVVAAAMLAATGSAADLETRLTFVRQDEGGPWGLFTIAPDGGPETRLVGDPSRVILFAWSPRGERIAFVTARSRDGAQDLYVADADGGSERRLARRVSERSFVPPSWAPDGRRIAFVRGLRIIIVDVATGAQRPLRVGPRRDLYPAWSPDGREIAYTTAPPLLDPLANGRIAVTDVGTGRTRVLAAGALPAWSPDGAKLAFRGFRGVSVAPRGLLSVVPRGGGRPIHLSNVVVVSNLSWSPDGRRILFTGSARQGSVYSIRTVADDGSEELVLSERSNYLSSPSWSPGGKRIVFGSSLVASRPNQSWIYTVNADGSCETLVASGGRPELPGWRPGGDVPPIRC